MAPATPTTADRTTTAASGRASTPGSVAGTVRQATGQPPIPPPSVPPAPPPLATASSDLAVAASGGPAATPRATLPPVRPPAPLVRTSSTAFKDPASQSSELTRQESPPEARKAMPAWLVSLIVHTVLLILLALISLPVGQGIGRIALEFGEATESSSVDLQTFDIEANDATAVTGDSRDDSPVDTNVQSLLDNVQLSDVSMELPTEVTPVGVGGVAEVNVPMFGGRSGAMKAALLATYGGSEQTINAVERGLRWLARNQDAATGSWSLRGPYSDPSYEENHTAATAMALIAFLGDGHVPEGESEYSGIVERGLRYLIRNQNRNGFFAGSVASNNAAAYSHAQATIALSEAYGMTRLSWLRLPAESGLRYAAEAQGNDGGWRYKPGDPGDLSVTGWYVLAIRSGLSADLRVKLAALQDASYFLDSVELDDGAVYQYMPNRRPGTAMTATGLLCRMYMGWPRNMPALANGIDQMTEAAPMEAANTNVYYWYYATQVLHHYGGQPWVRWNSVMKELLPKSQIKRGRESGSWSPQFDVYGESHGRLYQTCLSIYCLEVYYRHLPLYRIEP